MAVNRAIDHGLIIGLGFELPMHFSPIYFPMRNAATRLFVTFALLVGVVGVASAIVGINHIHLWNTISLPLVALIAGVAWTLTILVMGFPCKEIKLEIKNAHLIRMKFSFPQLLTLLTFQLIGVSLYIYI
ncbi:hypothetical protein CRYUN_Cryun31cG0125000 [Craigia yunnanensis]